MDKIKEAEIEELAETFKKLPYYDNGQPLSCAPQIYLKRGFIEGYKAALQSLSKVEPLNIDEAAEAKNTIHNLFMENADVWTDQHDWTMSLRTFEKVTKEWQSKLQDKE